MHTSITKEQLVNFVFNNVTEEEREKIIAAITSNPGIKERYLYEKRIHDVERYINDEMNIGESCEIEELIKMDSRLYDYFESNTEAIEEETNEEEQDVSITDEHLRIIKKQLVNFILNDDKEEYIGQYEKISKVINSSLVIKDIYLNEKRKHDVERYIDDKMDFGERCEFEELLKRNLRLYKYFELKKDLIEEQENILINLMYPSITRVQLVNFILNDLTGEEREKIMEAINTNPEIKEKYLFEKRKYDVERYLDDEMNIGERCEIEKRIKTDSRLFDYFRLNNGVIDEEQTVSINSKYIDITEAQLVNFVLNDVTEEEHKKITKAINTNPETKEKYLFEKRKYDVEKFIDDELDFGEACEIEELLKTDSRLFEYFELNKEVNEFVLTNLIERIKNVHAGIYEAIHNNDESGKIEDEVNTEDNTPVIELKFNVMRIGKWVAAASIIIFVSIFGMNYFNSNQNSLEERLYNSYYEPFQNSSNGFFNSTYMIEAKKKYNNREYDVAWVLINNLPNTMTMEAEKIFYTGLTLMELGNYTEAINKFQLLQANKELVVINLINQWYMALCYLKIEKRAEAIDILEEIVAKKNYNYTKAKKILKELS